MKVEWREFLSNNGAEFDDCDRVKTFGNPEREVRAALSGNVFADLSHLGMIEVHGKDAESFLQGQFSNDVRQLSNACSQLNGYCNPKGRLIASFRMFRRGDAYYLCLPMEMIEPLLKRLRMFILRADVTLEDISEAWMRVGLAGPDAVAELESAIGEAVPQAVDSVLEREAFSIIRVPGTRPRFEIFATLEAAAKIWNALNVRGAPVGAPVWELLDILAGVPTIELKTSELFVPQMVNMQLLGGVSFKKGCYPGQEVVARMQYLGKLKRRMYLVQIHSNSRPEPGEEIFSSADPEQSAGRIVSAQAHPDGGYRALAVIQIGAAADELFLGRSADARIDLLELPYAFEHGEETGER
jgi:hypothetical protein